MLGTMKQQTVYDTTHCSCNMAKGRGKRYSTGEAIEAIFADEDSNEETFDCGYDLDIIPDS